MHRLPCRGCSPRRDIGTSRELPCSLPFRFFLPRFGGGVTRWMTAPARGLHRPDCLPLDLGGAAFFDCLTVAFLACSPAIGRSFISAARHMYQLATLRYGRQRSP